MGGEGAFGGATLGGGGGGGFVAGTVGRPSRRMISIGRIVVVVEKCSVGRKAIAVVGSNRSPSVERRWWCCCCCCSRRG